MDSNFLQNHGFLKQLFGFRVLCCNIDGVDQEFFKDMYDGRKHDLMMSFIQLSDQRWKMELFSIKSNVSCVAIAQLVGGEGTDTHSKFIVDRLEKVFNGAMVKV